MQSQSDVETFEENIGYKTTKLPKIKYHKSISDILPRKKIQKHCKRNALNTIKNIKPYLLLLSPGL